MLAKLFEHNNWANLQIITTCTGLSNQQLDATPLSTSTWSIRDALSHLVESQQGYLSLLTLPPEARKNPSLEFAELKESAVKSGEKLLALTGDGAIKNVETRLRTMDGYLVDPWVVMVQVINHGMDHRRQISGMLRALGVTPPNLDGWAFGEAEGALLLPSK
jgi:uncharacterized damage-inducible protein DinB